MLEIQKLSADIRERIEVADYPAAEKLARRRLELSARAFGERHRAYGGSVLLLGRVLFLQGRYQEAEALLRRALFVHERAFDSSDKVSDSLLRLGEVLAAQNNYAEAEGLLRRAAAASKGHRHSLALIAQGQLMKDFGRYGEADALAHQALKEIEAAPGGLRGRRAALNLLAQSYDEQGRTAEAHALAQRGLAALERRMGEEHPEKARALVFLGKLLHEMQRDSEALELLQSARAISEKTLGLRHPLTGSAYLQLALVQDALGKQGEAEDYYRAAIKAARGTSVPLQLARASRAYGRHLVQRERLADALPYYREAIEMLGRVFAETRGQSEEIRQQFAIRFNAYHHELIELLVRLRDLDGGAAYGHEALAVASLTQSRIFSELLRQADVNQFVRDEAFKRLDGQRIAAVDRLRALRRELAGSGLSERELSPEDDDEDEASEESAAGKSGSRLQDARAENFARQVAEAKRQLAETESTLRRVYPRYMELTQPQPVTVADLQQRLLRPGEALLTYAVLPRRLVAFAVTRGQFAMTVVPLEKTALTARIRGVRAAGEEFVAGGNALALRKLDPAGLHELYGLLLAPPVDALLVQARHVLVAGDGPLHTLPLEMLVTRYGEAEREAFAAARASGPVLAEYATLPYLGARTRFSYLPSLSALPSQRLHAKPAVAYERELISFADPVFGSESRGASTRIPRLPETADEAREIAKLLGGKSGLYLRDAAQERTVKALDLKSTRYLHFATHGFLGGEFLSLRRGQPALALTLFGDLQGEDGLLTMKEVIESLDLNSQLVVLSACNTAGESNEASDGEGFAGLTRAFMYAGAKALLVSHWSVESLSTQDFIVDVFRHVKQGQTIGEAVYSARNAMLSATASAGLSRAHPYFWAPFVHVGD
jgi:CHAT domain-containing protein/TolA-binding protein